jgi:long-chain acyl-CoA synthetase
MIPFLPAMLPNTVAVCDDSEDSLTYSGLADRALQLTAQMPREKSLVFLYARNDIPTISWLLASLATGHAVALLDPYLPEASRLQLDELYQPAVVIEHDHAEVRRVPRIELHRDLAVLLSTSGSTGGAKFVRLTVSNLQANAASIASSLRISSGDVAAGHLPIHYSYGLSVLLSHLFCGAKTVLTTAGLMERCFWPRMRENHVSHLPGVPFHYEMLLRLGLARLGLPSLRTMTQAGGHLALEAREKVYRFMNDHGGRFYVMYGQTEAAPRIATLDHNDFIRFSGTVGRAIPGGRLVIRDESEVDLNAGKEGYIWYQGPNVMMGYAESIDDLARGDDFNGELPTGDIGWLGIDGHLTITGRAKRMGKIYGNRVNLDEIERFFKSIHQNSAVIQRGDKVLVYLAGEGGEQAISKLRASISQRFTLPELAWEFRLIDGLPVTDRGKVDYRSMESLE